MVSSFLTPFMASSMNVAMPLVGKEFGLNAVTLSWVLTAYILTAAMFLVPFGRLADITGRKRIFALGLSLDMCGATIGALAPSAVLLILARALQGVGGAMIFGTGIAILTSVYPPGARGRALGLNTAAVYSGLSLGPVLGGFIVHASGWRAIFLVTIPIAATALGLAVFRLKGEWADARGERFDFTGAAVFGAGLVALMYGFSRLPSVPGVAFIAAGLAALALFVVFELRHPAPLLDLRLFRHNRIFAFSNLAALFNYSATSAVAFLMSLYLQYIKGLPPQKAGLVLVAQPIVMALASPFAGRLSDRTEPRLIASAGMALSAAGLLLFARSSAPTTGFGFIVGEPHLPRPRLRPVLLAQYQRGHGLGRNAPTSASPRRPRDHAPDRADAERRHHHDDLRPGHGPGADHPRALPALPPQRPHRLRLLRRPLRRRRLRLARPGRPSFRQPL